MLTSIAGRSVIVTGASKGIGKGIAKVFARNGGKVLVVSRHLDEAEACAEELRRAGGTAKGHAADVTKIGDMQVMADAAVTAHGGIDILCANAGIYPQAKIEDLSAEDWHHVMATNLTGTFLPIKACLPLSQEIGPGPRRHYVVDNGAGHGLSRLGPLRRDQSRSAWLHAHGLYRARQVRHHRQRRAARQYPDRRLNRARAGIRAFDGGFNSVEEARDG